VSDTGSFLSVWIFYRIATLIGYDPEEVIGKTAYQFHNPLDAKLVGDCHQKCKFCENRKKVNSFVHYDLTNI
jgi:hypothetical protein